MGDLSPCDELEVEPAIYSDPAIRQQMIRSVDGDEDCVSVTTRVTIAAGADREVLHIPIYPPFETIPEVEAFVVSGNELRIRVTQKQRFGLRLEAVLTRPTGGAVESVIEIILRAKQKEMVCQPRREAA